MASTTPLTRYDGLTNTLFKLILYTKALRLPMEKHANAYAQTHCARLSPENANAALLACILISRSPKPTSAGVAGA